jgi:hypothetical protein
MVLFRGEVNRMGTTAQTPTIAEDAKESLLEPKEREIILRALDALLEGDEEEQRETFAYLKKALDEDRLSYRSLFSLE